MAEKKVLENITSENIEFTHEGPRAPSEEIQSTILNMIQHYTMMFGILQYFLVTSERLKKYCKIPHLGLV